VLAQGQDDMRGCTEALRDCIGGREEDRVAGLLQHVAVYRMVDGRVGDGARRERSEYGGWECRHRRRAVRAVPVLVPVCPPMVVPMTTPVIMLDDFAKQLSDDLGRAEHVGVAARDVEHAKRSRRLERIEDTVLGEDDQQPVAEGVDDRRPNAAAHGCTADDDGVDAAGREQCDEWRSEERTR
jgi:hypothetical protein